MTDFTASFGKPFAWQVAAWRLRLGELKGTERWTDLWQSQHDRAFMVAGAMKAELLADLAGAVDKAITSGGTLEAFRKDFRAIVQKNGWHGWTGEGTAKGEAWRTKVIYKTNMATSYAAGRLAQLRAGSLKFWVYNHGGSRDPRIQHLGWDGLVLDRDHPFWTTHAPPNGWGCRCYITGSPTREGAKRVDGKPDKTLPDDWQALDPKTGAPKGIDRGWDYAPGGSVSAEVREAVRIAADKIAALPPELGSAMGRSVQPSIDSAWSDWVKATVNETTHMPGFAGVIEPRVIAALEAQAVKPVSAALMVKPGLLRGPKVLRHEAAGNALSQEQWLTLPALLRDPLAVYRDTRSGALIYFLRSPAGMPQLAVRVDQVSGGRDEQKTVVNLIVSAYQVKPSDVLGRIRGNELIALFGQLE